MQNFDQTNLSSNEWLAALPASAQAELINVAKIKQFPKNACIDRKGETGGGLYGLLSGEVRVSASTFSGDEIVFTRILPGQWFGEIAVLDGGVRTHDSYTVVKSTLAIVPRQAIADVCQRSPETYRALVSLLCQHCRLAFAAIDEFMIYSPEQRMARRLIERLPADGSNAILISQSDLGAMVGVSRQSTNKILKRWESRTWINRVYGGVEINDREALQSLS